MTHEEWARRKRVEEEAKRQAASRLQELLDNRWAACLGLLQTPGLSVWVNL